jgi:hypothetical protein
MAADTFIIVSIDIAANRTLGLLDPEYSILRAIDHASIAFKAHATAHAAFALMNGLLFAQAFKALIKVAKHF